MPSLKENAIRVRHAAQLRVGGVDATYRRGEQAKEISLVRGSTDTAGNAVEGVPLLNTDSEWLALAEDLYFDEGPTLPKKNDEIWINRSNGMSDRYQVLRPSEDEECWRRSDPYGIVLRIYAKHRGMVSDEQ